MAASGSFVADVTRVVRHSRKALYENYIDPAIPVVIAPGYPKVMADFTIREERRFGLDVSVDGQLVIGMEFGRGLPIRLTPRQQQQISYSHCDGVTRETAFEHALDGVRTRFGGLRIRPGDHPYAKERPSLGLPKHAMVSSSVANVRVTFGDAQEIS
jgi:hypothetical protein